MLQYSYMCHVIVDGVGLAILQMRSTCAYKRDDKVHDFSEHLCGEYSAGKRKASSHVVCDSGVWCVLGLKVNTIIFNKISIL